MIGFQNVLLSRASTDVDLSDPEHDQSDQELDQSDQELDQSDRKLEQGGLDPDISWDSSADVTKNHSFITIDVFPWRKDSDLEELLIAVKSIEIDGVIWGKHNFVPGVKLNIKCELDIIKVSDDEILERINDLIDYVMCAKISS